MKDRKLEFIMKYFNSNFKVGKIEVNNNEKFNELNLYRDKDYEIIDFIIEAEYDEFDEDDEYWEGEDDYGFDED